MSTATVTRVNIISGPGIPVQGMPVEGVPIAHADGMPFYAPGRAVQMAPIGGRRGGAHVMYPHGGQSAAYHYDMGSHASAYPHPGMGGEGHSLADAVITEQQAAMELIPQFMARQLSRSLKLFSVIDILLCVLYVFGQFSFAAFAVIGPLCGYYGAKNYQRPYVACYILFCIINTAWRLAVFIFARSLLSQVIGMLMVMVEIYITRLVVRFYNLLKSFTDDELLELRITSNMPVQMVFW